MQLQNDLKQLTELLDQVTTHAETMLMGLDARPAAVLPPLVPPEPLPATGIGAAAALALFQQRWAAGLSGSAGPRYLGYVTGGVTPAALLGDWLTSVYDQNAAYSGDSLATALERETLGMLRELLGLPTEMQGSFVSGATMASFVGLALARQWFGEQHGVDVAQQGWQGLPALTVLSATPHSSIYKALAMLGLGRASLQLVACLPNREAVDSTALRYALSQQQGPCIVVGNVGTVNTGDSDDLSALAELKREFDFWLHVDAAFGGVAACAPGYRHVFAGIEQADSLTIDAHKWLNVPYDSAMQFSRHPQLQARVFQSAAAYLSEPGEQPDFLHLTPENSRRLRALATWFSLRAYGAAGYQAIVEQCCALAQQLAVLIAADSRLVLLAPVRLNIVCFTLAGGPSSQAIRSFLHGLQADGRVFLTPTVLHGVPAIRAAFSNWRTTEDDVALVWQAITEQLERGGI
jgi:glutamate/tyrosine decarboxylase-like PLP-dependent enzyme